MHTGVNKRTLLCYQLNWQLAVAWVLATVVSYSLAIPVIVYFSLVVHHIARLAGFDLELGGGPFVLLLAVSVAGIIVAVPQTFVLHRYLPDVSARQWIGAGVLGSLASYLVSICGGAFLFANWIANYSIQSASGISKISTDCILLGLMALAGTVAGLAIGSPQWLILREHVAHSERWLWANGGTGAVVGILWGIIGLGDWNTVIAGLLTGVVVGIIMGVTFSLLVPHLSEAFTHPLT